MEERWVELKPHVSRTVLILLAGIVWVLTGMMLLKHAIGWWHNYQGSLLVFLATLGVLLGVFKGYFIYTRVVKKNIDRISKFPAANFILSFITLRTYGLILLMMILGIVLRHSSFPKQYLAVIYLAVGLAMLFSGLPYFYTLISRYNKSG